jgi:non-specific serine/threonine protein kinase
MADLFISHASEDKEAVARPLAEALKAEKWEVWLDEDMLQIGDRLSTTIGAGLAGCRYGVVVLSPSFFRKAWPKRELEALIAREIADGHDLLLPVWHGVTPDEIEAFSAPLADRKGIPTSGGLEPVIAAILRVLRRAPPNNVPKLLDATVGRKEEIAEVRTALRQHRVVTIRGGAGVGKSRLAIEVSAAALSDPLWGVWFVELASVTPTSAQNPNLLPSEIGRIMGIPEQRTTPPLDGLIAHLASGHHLLVLDNCEHVVEPCRVLIDHLVGACPGVRVLTTSRTPLRALSGTGEYVYELEALKTLSASADVDRILDNESVRLFEIRAQARSSRFDVDRGNAPHIARLCEALEGNPLAIEVAAARLSVRSVEQMADDVRNFVAGLGNVESGTLRHWDSLTAALKWSLDLVPDAQRSCARAMSVFEGGWTEEAAGPVWLGGPSTTDVTAAMETLADHSLVVTRDSGKRKRFRYLEAVRQYLRSTLSPDEEATYQRRHAEWFCRLSEEAAPQFLKGSQREWLDRIQAEAGNLRAAVQWARGQGEAETVLKFLAALWRFAEIRGYYKEWRDSAQLALAMPEAEAFAALRSKVHSGAGMLAYRQGDFEEAEQHFSRSLAIEDERGDQAGRANALNDLGNVANMRGDFVDARVRFEQSMAIEKAQGNGRGVAVAQFNLGTAALADGDGDEAIALYAESLRGFRAGENVRESAFALFGLAQAHVAIGDLPAARGFAEECLRIRRDVGDQKGEGDIRRILGWLEIEAREATTAREHVVASLNRALELKDSRGVSEALAVMALWCTWQHRYDLAVRLFAASTQLARGLTFAKPAALLRRLDEGLAEAKRTLTEQTFKRVWLAGTLMTDAQAVAAAVEEERG